MEIREGRGIGGKDYVHLDLTHLGKAVIDAKLPDITEFSRVYQGVEPDHPAGAHRAHRALRDGRHPHEHRVARGRHRRAAARVLPGMYAAGECACVSVHGANRLGTNSLIDILVFGRRAGRSMADDVAGPWHSRTSPADAAEPVRGELEATARDGRRREPGPHPRPRSRT